MTKKELKFLNKKYVLRLVPGYFKTANDRFHFLIIMAPEPIFLC
jgi:hypothetical protein